jgi:hypothetical protein
MTDHCPICGRPAADAPAYGCPWGCAPKPKATSILAQTPSTFRERLKFVALTTAVCASMWTVALVVAAAFLPPLKRLAGPFACSSSYERTDVDVQIRTRSCGRGTCTSMRSELYCIDAAGNRELVDDANVYGSLALVGVMAGSLFGLVGGTWMVKSAGGVPMRLR